MRALPEAKFNVVGWASRANQEAGLAGFCSWCCEVGARSVLRLGQWEAPVRADTYRPWGPSMIFLSWATGVLPPRWVEVSNTVTRLPWRSMQPWRRTSEETNSSSWPVRLVAIGQALLLLGNHAVERTWQGSRKTLGHCQTKDSVPGNRLSGSEEPLLFCLSILVCSRTVIPGCYFGHRKPDGPGTGWRGGGVGREWMSHSTLPQK